MNITTYALGTISSLYEAALKNPGELTKSAVDYNKSMIMATKTASKALFVVGIALTVNDIVENKGSTDSILWGIADTGMSIIGFIPGGQLISGVYFTGRIAYQIYKDVNNN